MTDVSPPYVGQTETQNILRRTPRQGQGFIEPLLEVGDAIPLHMVLVPRGTFVMGSPEDEPGRSEDEGPQHKVTVPLFFMGRYPITQAQYKSLMGTNPATPYDSDRFVATNNPVVGVSWYDAVNFCDRLVQLTGRPYRLPSEAEWEYACRAGTTTPFHFGKTLIPEVANYSYRTERSYAVMPVSSFSLANAFGLNGMHGNVDEWCNDYWHGDYYGAPHDGSAWIEGGNSALRVLRGGSWFLPPKGCRSACRGKDGPIIYDNVIGFRVCCSAPRPLQ